MKQQDILGIDPGVLELRTDGRPGRLLAPPPGAGQLHGLTARTPQQCADALAEARDAARAERAVPALVNVTLAVTDFREGSISM